jgi:hypothetical protein
MSTLPKFLVGAVAAGAMAMVPTSAALAQYRDYDRERGGISVGDIIAGAVVLGGIAAVAGSLGRDRGYDYRSDERYYRDGRYGYYNGNPRNAVEQCVNVARAEAQRRGYRYAEVTDIRDVDDTRYGWRVKGRIAVDDGRGYYDRRYGRYDTGYYGSSRYGERYGYGRGYGRGADRDNGSFTCEVDRGRVTRLDYSGIRGL